MNTPESDNSATKSLVLPWAFIATALAEGALSYIGGRALSKVMGEPAYENIPTLIRAAVEDLKNFIRAELRKALEEMVIRDLEAKAEAIKTDLKRYADFPEASKPKNRYLLEFSDTNTSHGIASAQSYGLSALPVFVSFVSLRIVVIQAFYELDQSQENSQKFASELAYKKRYVETLLDDYYKNDLDPQLRLSEIYCDVRREGGQFPTEYTFCCCNQDAKPDDSLCAGSFNSSVDTIRPLAEAKRTQRAIDLSAEREKINENFIKPMKTVTEIWGSIIDKLNSR